MIKRRLKLLAGKLKEQGEKLVGRSTDGSKRKILEDCITNIRYAVPEVSREDIATIISGYNSQLRSLDKEIRNDMIKADRADKNEE